MVNAIELIKADHRKVEQLHQQYQGGNGQETKHSIIQTICYELSLHATLEEEIFYPAVERTLGKDGASLVTEARKEHSEMKQAISQLQAGEFAGPECEQVFRKMMQGVQHHVQEEEQELLPKAQQQLGAEIERLGTQMQQRKQELQNTTPGPGSQQREARRNE